MPEQTPQVPTFTDRLLSFMALPTETDPKVNMVLLGSGSSIEAGYPGGSDLDRIFREAGLRVYSEIATATLPAERPDVERVLRVMEHLAEYQADSLAHDLSMLGITLGKLSMYGNTPEQLADRCAAEVHAIRQLLRKNLWKRWPLPPLKEPAKPRSTD